MSHDEYYVISRYQEEPEMWLPIVKYKTLAEASDNFKRMMDDPIPYTSDKFHKARIEHHSVNYIAQSVR